MPYKKPEKVRLTKKQELIARARVRDPNASLSELGNTAGYRGATKQIVAISAWKSVNSPNVKARIRELMDQRPATSLGGLLNTLEDGLGAKRTQFFAHEGKVVSSRTTKDYATRRGYLDTALEMHGAKERTESGVTNNFFTKDAIEAFVAAFKRPPANGDNT